MVYGAKAVIPTDLWYGSPRVRAYQPDVAKEARTNAIDLLEEPRDSDGTMRIGFTPRLSR
jgi:hypothetical protein